MLTSVFISNSQINVVSGKTSEHGIKMQSAVTALLPQGAMLGGMIMDENAVKNELLKLCKNKVLPKSGVRLVIDSNAVLIKLAQVPMLSHKRLVEFTKNNFMEIANSYENLLYDYSVLNHNTILCSAVEQSLIESYLELFSAAGIGLYSIDIALNCVIKLSAYFKCLQEKTYVLSVVDGSNVSSTLFTQGHYSFSNRYRLLAERGTPECTTEMTRTISSLLQFNKAQKGGHEITDIYFCGLTDQEKPLYNALSTELGVAVSELPLCESLTVNKKMPASFSLADYLYATGNLIRK